MPIAKSRGEVRRYVLKREREEEKPTVVLLRAPTYRLQKAYHDKAVSVSDESQGEIISSIPMGTAASETCRQCMVGWESLLDEKGDKVEFLGHASGASEVDLEKWSFSDLFEIAEECWRLGRLGEQSGGNSSPPPTEPTEKPEPSAGEPAP